MQNNTIFLIGHILAITLLVRIAYVVIFAGFKSYFHLLKDYITEVEGGEKSIFYKINAFFLIVSGLLSPIILFAYPKFVDRFPDEFESSENFLLHVIAATIYIAAMLGCFYHLCYALRNILKSRKDKKRFK